MTLQQQVLRESDSRTIFDKAKDVASVYEMDALTIREGPDTIEFSFDNQIVNTAAYRAAWTKQTVRNQTDGLIAGRENAEEAQASSTSPVAASSITSPTSTPSPSMLVKSPTKAPKEIEKKKRSSLWRLSGVTQVIPNKKQSHLQEQLSIWAARGDLGMVRDLVAQGADPAASGSRKHAHCLIAAVTVGSTEVVQFLLEHGADVNALHPRSKYPCLAIAIDSHTSNVSLISAILQHGPDMTASVYLDDGLGGFGHGYEYVNVFHLLALHYQAPNASEVAELIHSYGGELLNRFSTVKANGPGTSLSTYYIAKSADGFTPLQALCLSASPKTAKEIKAVETLIITFVRLGASIHMPFGKAVNSKADDVFLELCRLPKDSHVLIQALLKSGAKTNIPNMPKDSYDKKRSALELACISGSAQTAIALLEHGAASTASFANWDRSELLHLAVRMQSDKLVHALIDLGLEVNAVNDEGKRPLHVACTAKDMPLTIVKSLIEAGADLRALDKESYSAWNYACEFSRAEVTLYLSSLPGADIHVRSGPLKGPPLWYALGRDNSGVVECLIKQLGGWDGGWAMYLDRAFTVKASKSARVLLQWIPNYRDLLTGQPGALEYFDGIKRTMDHEIQQRTTMGQGVPRIQLPSGWERRVSETGRPYYVNHVSETTQWHMPM
jgi:ankyrin repeat protein